MTTAGERDAIVARAEKIQSVGGSLLANATALKNAVLALDVEADPPPVTDPQPPPDPEPEPEPVPGADWTRPTAQTTGVPVGVTLAPGTLPANAQIPDGTVYDGLDFPGTLKIQGSNITIRNCRAKGVIFYGPGPLVVEDCDLNGGSNCDASYRDIDGVRFTRVHVVCGDHDGIDLFSQPEGRVSNVVIEDSLIDGQDFPADSTSHGDGIQVRGISGLRVERVVLDMGAKQPQKNAALYFEDVNGGCEDMHITDVDIYGGDPYNHTFYTNAVTASTATNVTIKRGGYVTRANPSGWTFEGVTDPSGSPINT